MKNRWSIIFICFMCAMLMCGCKAEKDDIFAQDGKFEVLCINETQSNPNNRKQKKYYYYEQFNEIYRYSLESETQEMLYDAEYTIWSYCIAEPYLFYTYSEEGIYKVNRLNLQTKENSLMFENQIGGNIYLNIENNYIYITVEETGIGGDTGIYAYRCPLNGDFITDYEETNDYYKTSYGFSTDEEQRVNLGKKSVIIRRNWKDDEIPYSYQVEGKDEQSITCFEESEYRNSALYQQYMCQEDESTIIGLINVSGDPRVSVQLSQNQIKRDILFSLNVDTGENKILYDTKNNRTRIIGYDKGVIYLFKNNYKIYSLSLKDGKETELMSIPKSDDIVFDWCENYLIVRYRDINAGINPQYHIQTRKIVN